MMETGERQGVLEEGGAKRNGAKEGEDGHKSIKKSPPVRDSPPPGKADKGAEHSDSKH